MKIMKTKVRLGFFVLSVLILTGIMVSCKKDVNVESIILDKTDATVMVGNSVTLNVIFSPIDATNKNIDWQSDDPSVATVSNGMVTGVALGQVKQFRKMIRQKLQSVKLLFYHQTASK